jgi:hypothetical protein
VRAPVLADFRAIAPSRFEPVWLTSLLEAPIAPAWAFALFGLCLASCVAFTLGIFSRLSGPLAAFSLLWVTSYRNSFGMVFHTDNLLVLHLLVLGLVPRLASASWSLDARWRARRAATSSAPTARVTPSAHSGWPLRVCAAITVLAYLIAGVAKLEESGLVWMSGDILRNHIAYDAVRKAAVGSMYSPLGGVLVQVAWPFPVLGALTLAFELGAPLALVGPRLAALWALGAFGFHVGVLALMAIAFPYPLAGVAFAPLFAVERVFERGPLRGIARWLGAGARG